jgi:hypothetical protein
MEHSSDDRMLRAMKSFFFTSTIFVLILIALSVYYSKPLKKSNRSSGYHNIGYAYITEAEKPAFKVYLFRHQGRYVVSSERPDVVFSVKFDNIVYSPSGKIISMKASPNNDVNKSQTKTYPEQSFFDQDEFIRFIEKRGAKVEIMRSDLKPGEKEICFHDPYRPASW